MKFNINDEVAITLTEVGKAIIEKEGLQVNYTAQPDGTHTVALWVLMHDFGKHMYMGGEIPFETTITIPKRTN